MTGFFTKSIRLLVVSVVFLSAHVRSTEMDPHGVVLTNADAAVILAKYSGLFDRHISEDASLSDCVAFLNKIGVYFGLMEVINGSEFKPEDCARVMGQIELVMTGEAEYAAGKVKLPNNIVSWVDFCILSDIKYLDGYRTMRETLRVERMRAL